MTEDSSPPGGQAVTSRRQKESNQPERDDKRVDSPKCMLKVELDEHGNVEVAGLEGACTDIFDKLPPIRKEFWKRRMQAKLRDEIERPPDKQSDQQVK